MYRGKSENTGRPWYTISSDSVIMATTLGLCPLARDQALQDEVGEGLAVFNGTENKEKQRSVSTT